MSQKSKKNTEQTLFSNKDQQYHNVSTLPPNQQDPFQQNGQVPYDNNYWYGQQPPYWNPSMDPMQYNQNPEIPYNYPMAQPVQPQYLQTTTLPPAPISKKFIQSNAVSLPPAPRGRNPEEPFVTPLSNSLYNPAVAVMPPGYVQPVSVAPGPVVPIQSVVPNVGSYSAVPVALQQPVPTNVLQPSVIPGIPLKYGEAVPPLHYPQGQYVPQYSPHHYPPHYYPSHHYPSHHYPSSPHYYHHEPHLPPIRRRRRHRDYEDSERYYRSDRVIKGYFGLRHNVDKHRR